MAPRRGFTHFGFDCGKLETLLRHSDEPGAWSLFLVSGVKGCLSVEKRSGVEQRARVQIEKPVLHHSRTIRVRLCDSSEVIKVIMPSLFLIA